MFGGLIILPNFVVVGHIGVACWSWGATPQILPRLVGVGSLIGLIVKVWCNVGVKVRFRLGLLGVTGFFNLGELDTVEVLSQYLVLLWCQECHLATKVP